MAGLFGLFDYSRPGKGVNKNEPEKKGAALFFELLTRKFWNYIKLSILYAVTCVPTLIYFTFAGMFLFQDIAVNSELSSAVIILSFMMAMAAVLFFSGSIFRPGFDYVLRNYARQEHAWIISDFFQHTKSNFKQSLCVYLIDIVILTLAMVNLRFYMVMSINSGNNIVFIIMMILFVAALAVYSVMQSYIGTMMVTFRLKLSEIYKNAFIFSILGIKNNFISFVIRAGLFGLAFYFLNPLFAAVLYAVILVGAAGLVSELSVYPVIKKYMLDKLEAVEEEHVEDENFYGDENDEFSSSDKFENIEFTGPNDVASLFKTDTLKEQEDNNEKI